MKKYLPIIAVIVSIVGIVVPIVWGVTSQRHAIEVSLVSSISILENDPIVDKMAIYYEDTRISNLSKYLIKIYNSGKVPIVDDDVKKFPTFSFNDTTTIIASKIESRYPNDLEFATKLLNETSIETRFSLLNPGDFANISIYVSSVDASLPSVVARIRGIKSVTTSGFFESKNQDKNDLQQSKNEEGEAGWRWYDYVAIFFSGAFVLVGISNFIKIRRQKMVQKFVESNPQSLKDLSSIVDIANFFSRHINFIGDEERKKIVNQLSDGDISEDVRYERGKAMLLKVIASPVEEMGTVVIGIVLGAAGMIYYFVL